MIRRRRSTTRQCLRKSLKIVNVVVNICGVGMIIYALCLRKLWVSAVAHLPLASQVALPQPWFIFTCLGVGITVCLSTLAGHMIANCISNSTLCFYIVSLSALLLLQGIVIVAIFFKMDLKSKINNIDDNHASFRNFALFHLYMCRVISILALVAQINVVILAVILCVVGAEPMDSGGDIFDVSDSRHSFLVSPHSPMSNESIRRTRSKFEFLCGVSPIESYFSCQRNGQALA